MSLGELLTCMQNRYLYYNIMKNKHKVIYLKCDVLQ
jgi:hypothetical protein